MGVEFLLIAPNEKKYLRLGYPLSKSKSFQRNDADIVAFLWDNRGDKVSLAMDADILPMDDDEHGAEWQEVGRLWDDESED